MIKELKMESSKYTIEYDDEKHLRQIMTSITQYSREQEFCRRLRKTDKKHLTYSRKLHTT